MQRSRSCVDEHVYISDKGPPTLVETFEPDEVWTAVVVEVAGEELVWADAGWHTGAGNRNGRLEGAVPVAKDH